MKCSEQWLREWVDPAMDTDALVERLSLLGLEVDTVTPAAPPFSGVVVGRIITAQQHPDADRLQVCSVLVAEDATPLQIVCGAKNARAGLSVAVATVGAVLPGDFKIKRSKLRGVLSEGMLCGASELGLEDELDGIMVLPSDAPLGQDFRDYMQLDDNVIAMELTPDRGDCLSVRGIARDVAAYADVPLTPPAFEQPEVHASLPAPAVRIEDASDCTAYACAMMQLPQAVASCTTPLAIKLRLQRSGLRPVNAVVDACNYVMLALGQPLHAYDAAKLKGGMEVKRAKGGESLALLDGKTATLNKGTLVVCDEAGIQAIAGVMGAEASAVSDQTQQILLESACFSPVTLGLFSRSLGIHSDAAHRFERGVDPCGQREALCSVMALLQAWCSGASSGEVSEAACAEAWAPTEVLLREAQLARYLGVTVPPESIAPMLARLGFEVTSVDEGWSVTVPSFRTDVALEVDVIEEVARLYGYDKIPTEQEYAPVTVSVLPSTQLPMHALRLAMKQAGYMECVHYSFTSKEALRPFAQGVEPLALSHPLSSDLAVMRTSLLPALLKTAVFNRHRQVKQLRLYEVGHCYVPEGRDVREEARMAMLLAGEHHPEQWGDAKRRVDFYDLKGDVEAWFKGHGLALRFEAEVHEALHPGRTARIYHDDQPLGWLGAVHPRLAKSMDLDVPTYVCELALPLCVQLNPHVFKPISAFPAVRRDLAFVVPAETQAQRMLDWISAHCGALLVDVRVFDLYQGGTPEKATQSMALGLTFQAVSRTLVDEEVNELIQGVVEGVQRKFKAELRA